MKRAIITPAPITADALDELKHWLVIAGTQEDPGLTALLRAALDLCEAFTGTAPLELEAEEILPATAGWQPLATRPVGTIVSAQTIASDGTRQPIASSGIAFDIDAGGVARVNLSDPQDARRMAIRFTAGLAPDWTSLPAAMRHGIVRMAAHNYRERDRTPDPTPPAAIAAMWQPWRRMRLL